MNTNSPYNLNLNHFEGRDILYQQCIDPKKKVIITTAFEEFEDKFAIMNDNLSKLLSVSAHNAYGMFSYNLHSHTFELVDPRYVELVPRISLEEREEYAKDYLHHNLIPELVKKIIGNTDEKDKIILFIEHKLNFDKSINIKDLHELSEKIKSGNFLSLKDKQIHLNQKAYKESDRGQLEEKERQLRELKGLGLSSAFSCENLIRRFSGINLDILEEAFQNPEQSPAKSPNMQSLKKQLITLMPKLKNKTVVVEDFKSISNWRTIDNTPSEWSKIGKNSESIFSKSVFEEFRDVLKILMKELYEHDQLIESLEKEISALKQKIPMSTGTPSTSTSVFSKKPESRVGVSKKEESKIVSEHKDSFSPEKTENKENLPGPNSSIKQKNQIIRIIQFIGNAIVDFWKKLIN